jgi:putative PIN family toxin of toxin-antitoxin system
MIRAVVDANIPVRALIKPRGTVGPILQSLRDAEYQIIYSDPLLTELADVLARPRFAAKYGLSADDAATVLALILLRGEPVLATRRIDACRDPKDNMVLEAAVAGQVDVIVSGDGDLLSMSPFEGIPVLEPATFLRRLTSRHTRS